MGGRPVTLDPATVTLVLGIGAGVGSLPRVRKWLNKPRKATTLEERVDGLEVRERVLLDYIEDLRAHISEGKAPPPPDWPDVLKRRRNFYPTEGTS
ncbi:MAG: hypothetical protein AB7G17_14310 [Phycisphaerales bacterium]